MSQAYKDVPILGIDKQSWAFLDAQGTRYFEVSNDLFVVEGPIEEGTIGHTSTVHHGGYVVLKPFYVYHDGAWRYLSNGNKIS